MLVKFFKHGSNNANSCVDYLLGRDRKRSDALLLRGDVNETVALTEASLYAKKYTSGCLSFEESDLNQEQKQALMDGFEECLFTGLDSNQYNCLWVEHRDKGRLELNFVIPNVELTTGRRLQPYYHEVDNYRVEAWRDIQNIEYGFSAPDDPSRRQIASFTQDMPKDKREAKEAITSGLMTLIEGGLIRNREELISTLESNGFEVARVVKQSISIKDPDGGRNIRLTGAIYEQDFRFSESLSSEIERRAKEYRERSEERLRTVSATYQRGIEAKRAFNLQRYSATAEQIEGIDQPTVQNGRGGDSKHHWGDDSEQLVLRLENIVTGERNKRYEIHDKSVREENRWHSSGELPFEEWDERGLCEDRPEAASLWERKRIQSDSEVGHDRNRTSFIEHLKRLGNTARERTERIIEKIRAIGTREPTLEPRESGNQSESDRLKYNIGKVVERIETLDKQKQLARRESIHSRGFTR
jgi:hypothetical protein